jgi:hypothetical protein
MAGQAFGPAAPDAPPAFLAGRDPWNVWAMRDSIFDGPVASGFDALDGLQITLDVLGMSPTPIVSTIADIGSAGLSLYRRDTTGALISLGASVPFLGVPFEAIRLGRRGVHLADEVGDAFEYYLRQAETLNFSTPRNGAVFYSGLGNRALAEEFAAINGRMTLEMTQGGRWLDAENLFGPSSPLTQQQAYAVWARASQRFAEGTSGVAFGFVRGSRPTSISESIEYPALLRNGEVTNLITGGF